MRETQWPEECENDPLAAARDRRVPAIAVDLEDAAELAEMHLRRPGLAIGGVDVGGTGDRRCVPAPGSAATKETVAGGSAQCSVPAVQDCAICTSRAASAVSALTSTHPIRLKKFGRYCALWTAA